MIRMNLGVSFRGFAACLLISAFFYFPSPLPAADPPSPLGVVQSGTDRILLIVKASLTGDGPPLRQRRSEIIEIVDEYFNFAEMARRSLGRPWKDQSREKQQRFVTLFKQILFNVYVGRIENTASPTTRFSWDRVMVDGEYGVVKTRAVNDKTAVAEIEYRLRLLDGGWKVYDVVVEGISLIANYREQFDSFLSRGSFDDLLACLKAKVDAEKIP